MMKKKETTKKKQFNQHQEKKNENHFNQYRILKRSEFSFFYGLNDKFINKNAYFILSPSHFFLSNIKANDSSINF